MNAREEDTIEQAACRAIFVDSPLDVASMEHRIVWVDLTREQQREIAESLGVKL